MVSSKSKIIDIFLCVFLGMFGVHKLYEGKIGMFFLYLFTGGLFYIGWIVDIFIILTNKATDKNGNKIVDKGNDSNSVVVTAATILIVCFLAAVFIGALASGGSDSPADSPQQNNNVPDTPVVTQTQAETFTNADIVTETTTAFYTTTIATTIETTTETTTIQSEKTFGLSSDEFVSQMNTKLSSINPDYHIFIYDIDSDSSPYYTTFSAIFNDTVGYTMIASKSTGKMVQVMIMGITDESSISDTFDMVAVNTVLTVQTLDPTISAEYANSLVTNLSNEALNNADLMASVVRNGIQYSVSSNSLGVFFGAELADNVTN